MTTTEALANRIYGEDASEVLEFLKGVAPDKHEFRSETTFLNFVARKLEPQLKSKARQDQNNADFWENRAMSMDIGNQLNKAENVLWCIRLLNGKCRAPEDDSEDYLEDYPED